jgi:GDPmannose 4,6-dehydratase
MGLQETLFLGNLDARRDWGHARDYVEMQWLMLQQDQPEDYVIATGQQHSVREFVESAGDELELSIQWKDKGLDEKGIDENTGKVIIAIDPRYFRPTEVDTLLGDATKAREKLGWQPRIAFKELVSEMVAHDLKEAQRDQIIRQEGFQTFNNVE